MEWADICRRMEISWIKLDSQSESRLWFRPCLISNSQVRNLWDIQFGSV